MPLLRKSRLVHQNRRFEKYKLFRCTNWVHISTMKYGYARVSTGGGSASSRANEPCSDGNGCHAATACRHCQACLTAARVTGVERRQVFDLPEPRVEVTEHQASIYRCQRCRGTTKAAFPDAVTAPVQYGSRLRATAVYLNVQQLIPEGRVCETMADLAWFIFGHFWVTNGRAEAAGSVGRPARFAGLFCCGGGQPPRLRRAGSAAVRGPAG